jgi:2-aminoethylphosphonate-pyruvate transaminase
VLNNKAAFMKKFADYLTLPTYQQPLLCTHIACHLEAETGNYVFYTPRSSLPGSIVCHLGEVHLKEKAQGDMFQDLKIVPLV